MENRTIELIKSINLRVGTFLRQERKLSGKTIAEVSKPLGIDPMLLARWEKGLSSPPGYRFYSILKLYGPSALKRAETLDMQLQYERAVRIGSLKPPSPKPRLTLIRCAP